MSVGLLALGLAGCCSVRLDSHGDKVAKPIVSEWFCCTVWGGLWWGESPEERCRIVQPDSEGRVSTHGFRRVEITGNWWSVPVSGLTLGVCVPVHVECFEALPDVGENPPREPIRL